MPDQQATHGPYYPEKQDRKSQAASSWLKNFCQEFSYVPPKQSQSVAVSRARNAALSVGMAPFVRARKPDLVLIPRGSPMAKSLFGHERFLSAHRGSNQFFDKIVVL